MGTMAGWGGSGGKWNKVRNLSEELVDEVSEVDEDNLEGLVDAVLDGLDADSDVTEAEDATRLPLPVPGGPSWSHGPRMTRGGGSGDGPSGGGRGGEGGSGGRAGGGRSRSSARAAGVGGAVLAAAMALREEDAKTLEELGLNLDELRSFSALRRNNAILNAVVGVDGGIEDAGLRRVGTRVLTAVLQDGLDAVEAVRLYIAEYCFEVWALETGERLRSEPDRAKPTHDFERQLRAALRARTRQIKVAPASGESELRNAIERSLELMRGLSEGS